MSSLKNQAVNSAKWTTARTLVTSLTGPILLIIKTNYLTPAEFGVMAIINIFISLIAVVENFGFNTAIIRKDVVTKDERSSLFILQLGVGFLLAFLLVVLSPFFGDIFDMGRLETLLPILSLSIIFNSPVTLFTAFLEKEFHFKELSIIQIIRELTLLVSTTLFFQFFTDDLLAVVIGQIVAVGVMAILIVGVSFKNDLLHLSFHFKFDDIKPYFKFGVAVAGKQLLIQITHNVDEMIIGLFLDETILGYYHFAKNLLNKFRQILTTSFSKILLPLLSKVKNNKVRLFRAYNLISVYIATVTFPVFTGIALTTNSFIPVFFDEGWLSSSNFFIILAIGYIPYLISPSIGNSLLYTINKPKLSFVIDFVNNISYILILFIFSWINAGIYPVVILYALYMLVKSISIQYFVYKEFDQTLLDYFSLFKGLLMCTVAMVIGVLGIQFILPDTINPIIELIVSVIIGAGVYIGSLYMIERKIFIDLLQMVTNR